MNNVYYNKRMEQKVQWHTKTISEIFELLNSHEHGLAKEEAERRLKEYGFNTLPEAHVDSLVDIFFHQFRSPLIYILLAASFIVFVMGEIVDSSIILFVLFFNAIVGTLQEGKAQNTLSALKKFVETNTTVLRDGKDFIIPDIEVVPGDVIELIEGDKIPADARIIISHNLKIDEASLTGESEPIHKVADVLTNNSVSIAEQKNMIFKGTHIVAGNG
ncbi:MAG: HAD-IC family P-type ATPase, partial [Patescibacteria group bacterium]